MNPNQPSDTSQNQLTANRDNAKKSTGPKTPAGKQRSSQNARKHGFTASTFAVVRLEDLDEIANLKSDLINDHHPQTAQELFAIERLALAQQSLLRLARVEAGLFTAAFDTALNSPTPLRLENVELIGGIDITRAQNRNHAVAAGFHQMTKESNSWALLMRYQAQADRVHRRAQEDLDRLIAKRPNPARQGGDSSVFPNEPISLIEEPEPEQTKPLDELEPPPDPAEPVFVTQVMRNEKGCVTDYYSNDIPRSAIKDIPVREI